MVNELYIVKVYVHLISDVDEDVEHELDEATRQFNFWTHQIHIFFVRKFLPAAENMIRLKQAVEKNMLEADIEKRSDMKSSAESRTELVEPNQVIIEEKTQA